MEDAKLIALHETLSKLTGHKGLGSNGLYSWQKNKNHDESKNPKLEQVRSNLPQNQLYAHFLPAGTYDPNDESKQNHNKNFGDGRYVKRDFSDITNDSDNNKPNNSKVTYDSVDSNGGDETSTRESKKKRKTRLEDDDKIRRKEEKRKRLKLEKLEAKKKARLDEKKRLKKAEQKLRRTTSQNLIQDGDATTTTNNHSLQSLSTGLTKNDKEIRLSSKSEETEKRIKGDDNVVPNQQRMQDAENNVDVKSAKNQKKQKEKKNKKRKVDRQDETINANATNDLKTKNAPADDHMPSRSKTISSTEHDLGVACSMTTIDTSTEQMAKKKKKNKKRDRS
jgi:colicin import membrane protein